ncbi:Hcp family type VI secretion system effector [Salmonella enterica subsp. enterica]|nr:Hcp family type VI secretion system effector [Salmonella enterica subsp. enterica]
MANLSYLTLVGEKQGKISAGCSSLNSVGNKAQITHTDEIMVYALMHSISRSQNVNHHELVITKPVDKSSPLLAKAISDNEIMTTCDFTLYRTSKEGVNQSYYTIRLSKARISNIDFVTPHSVLEKEVEPQERVAFAYETITWEHNIAGTSTTSKWEDRVQ